MSNAYRQQRIVIPQHCEIYKQKGHPYWLTKVRLSEDEPWERKNDAGATFLRNDDLDTHTSDITEARRKAREIYDTRVAKRDLRQIGKAKAWKSSWKTLDKSLIADASLTLRPCDERIPLSADAHNWPSESLCSQVARLLRDVEMEVYGEKAVRYRRYPSRLFRTVYTHPNLDKKGHHCHLYITKPEKLDLRELECLFRKKWYENTYEIASKNWRADHPTMKLKRCYEDAFPLTERHFKWVDAWDEGWKGYGARREQVDDRAPAWQDRLSFIP